MNDYERVFLSQLKNPSNRWGIILRVVRRRHHNGAGKLAVQNLHSRYHLICRENFRDQLASDKELKAIIEKDAKLVGDHYAYTWTLEELRKKFNEQIEEEKESQKERPA